MGVPDADIERLYEELGAVLLAYARSIVQDVAEAEDALQHVFLKMITSGNALPNEPRPYLFRAVRNTCLNRQRSEARERAWRCEPPMFAAPPALEGLASDIEAALRELPEEQREVVVLRVWGEMTLAETAQVLSVPLNTVASRYRYAVAKLRQRFGMHLRS